ncbi:MAG: methyltransferase [Alphaproteobacteria bacterium]
MADPAAFIRANTRLLPVPHAPEIRLYMADEATELWRKTEEELGAIGLPPPYWAFAWAGGQALARYVLDAPGLVAGRRVLDFGAGSGLAGIAAACRGARVLAADIDGFALAAIALNAEANGVAVAITAEDQIGRDDGWDIVLAGDVCYERAMAAGVADWLAALAARGARVLIGDPGRAYLPKDGLAKLAEYMVPTTTALEDHAVRRTAVYALA